MAESDNYSVTNKFAKEKETFMYQKYDQIYQNKKVQFQQIVKYCNMELESQCSFRSNL